MNEELNEEETDWLNTAWEYMLTSKGEMSACPSKKAWNAYAYKCKILMPLHVNLKEINKMEYTIGEKYVDTVTGEVRTLKLIRHCIPDIYNSICRDCNDPAQLIFEDS